MLFSLKLCFLSAGSMLVLFVFVIWPFELISKGTKNTEYPLSERANSNCVYLARLFRVAFSVLCDRGQVNSNNVIFFSHTNHNQSVWLGFIPCGH